LPQPQAFPIKRFVLPHFGTIQGDSGRTKPLRKIAENLHEDDTRCWLKHAANIAHCHITRALDLDCEGQVLLLNVYTKIFNRNTFEFI
jgi:hypothetical protein